MKKIIFILLVLVTFNYANNCKDWSNNSDNCLNDTTLQRPKFGNTETYMQIGDTACRTYDEKYYTYQDSIILKNGLSIKIMLPRRICREIEDISLIKIPNTIRVPKTKIDYSCCDRNHATDMRLYGTNKYKTQCYYGEGSISDDKCKHTFYVDSTVYTKAYQIKYSDSANVTFEFSFTKTRIELSSDYYIDDDFVEIYREDGTLKYRGEITYVPADLENLPTYKTRGWCYDKTGTKEIRKTNNVNLCK